MLLGANATVTICHSRTNNLADHIKQADIVVGAVGKPAFIKAEWIKAGIKENTIDGSVDADEVANFFCAMIVGIVYQWLLNPDDLDAIKALYNDLKSTMQSKLTAA